MWGTQGPHDDRAAAAIVTVSLKLEAQFQLEVQYLQARFAVIRFAVIDSE